VLRFDDTDRGNDITYKCIYVLDLGGVDVILGVVLVGDIR
jgi:hypothetical protein